jgi:3-deoxy-7-phosphoheptulonate synthase
MIDASHSNSEKKFKRQLIVADDVANQIRSGQTHIMGIMIESNLVEGNQPIGDISELVYGQSVTDACIGWDDTEKVLATLAKAVQDRRALAGK